MDALKLLKDDHKRIKDLLTMGVDTSEQALARRTTVLHDLTRELKIHERREEEVLYPALKAAEKTRELVLEGQEEHHITDSILTDLNATDYTDERWRAKFKVLKDTVEHHIDEEEHGAFKETRKLLGGDELERLGARMAEINDVNTTL